jgi:uncharacterized protein
MMNLLRAENNVASSTTEIDDTEDAIREFILDDHPCVMAQSIVADDSLTVADYGLMNTSETYEKLLEDLKAYLKMVNDDNMKFLTFIATFDQELFETELAFEEALWKLLYNLHKIDPLPWDVTTDPDTKSSKFSYSLLQTSFYIVGMHPESSRHARSAPFPMVVFNLHSQFEMLRNAGRYTRVRDLIRKRDKAYQGSINPMLEDFGENSEARQYSGRKVDENWKCPYHFDK